MLENIFGEGFDLNPVALIPLAVSWILFFVTKWVSGIKASRRASASAGRLSDIEHAKRQYESWYESANKQNEKLKDALKAVFLMGEVKAFKKILAERSNGFSFGEAEKLTQMTTSLAMLLNKAYPDRTFEQAIDILVKEYAGDWWKSAK